MGIVVMVGQLLLALSLLVALHELGHLLTAKWFKMRVEQYSIGFPPKIYGFKKGETEYMIGSIPLGGYVKISGMVDESLDTATLNEPPKPWEFRSKPAWQRLIVMLGGVTVNVITGIVIFVFLVWVYGESYQPANKVAGIKAYKIAEEIGLKTGDKIVKVNGKPLDKFEDALNMDVFLGSGSSYTIERGNQSMVIAIPNDLMNKLGDKKNTGQFIEPLYDFSVGEVSEDYPAFKAGLKEGDKIVQINETPIKYYQDVQGVLSQNKGKEVAIHVLRKGKEEILKVKTTEEGKVGFSPTFDNTVDVNYSFLEAIPKGTVMAFDIVFLQIKSFAKMFRGEVSATKSLSGPVGIAKMFGSVWIWGHFWKLTGLLSMVLAFMNLLPIPALDGGHVMFLTFEIISGRKPSDKFLEVAQKVGMVLLLCLMVFAVVNDFFK